MPQSQRGGPTLPTHNAVAFDKPSLSSKAATVWASFKRSFLSSIPTDSLGNPTNTSNAGSSVSGGSAVRHAWMERRNNPNAQSTTEVNANGEVDVVIVERTDAWGVPKGQGGRATTVVGGAAADGTSAHNSDRSSLYEERRVNPAWGMHWWKGSAWPLLLEFFDPRYHHHETEAAFQKEVWYAHKTTHLLGACFLIVNTVLVLGLTPKPWSTWLYVSNCGLQVFFTFPLIPFILLNLPKKKPLFWQTWLFIAIWLGCLNNIIDMSLCDFYSVSKRHCGNRDFIGAFYQSTALPVAALFALGQKRSFAFVGIVLWTGVVFGAIVPQRVSFLRTAINWIVFQCFALYFNYMRERETRRTYTLRANLKTQFRATQRAQIRERKQISAKERLQSYLFHELRSPLNISLLAFQNLEANKAFKVETEHEVELSALEGSLQTMRVVLNSILDFTRMEKGGFSSVNKPFSFHRVMRSISEPLQLDAHARGLSLVTEFDERIDLSALKAAYPEEKVELEGSQEGKGLVIGDELRLQQVINNLASNACKFTAPGGSVTVRTMLVFPQPEDHLSPATKEHSDRTSITAHRLHEHENVQPPANTSLVVRIEVQDTGIGISPRDMVGLFTPYVQTEAGLSQGGKGTGLGLSLCRQIVSLSRGRLGVRSKLGEGTTMWIEMPFAVGPQVATVEGINFEREKEVEEQLGTPRTFDVETNTEYDFGDMGTGDMSGHMETQVELDERVPTIKIHDFAHTEFEMTSRMSPIAPSSPSALTSVGAAMEAPVAPPSAPVSPLPAPPARHVEVLLPPAAPLSHHASDPSVVTLPPIASVASPLGGSGKAAGSRAMLFENGPMRVLVCDDDSLTRKLMSRMLGRLGCQVQEAENGALALELWLAGEEEDDERENFDITFLDNQMPIMTGVQAVARLRSNGREDLVVGVTANALIQDQEQFIQAGATSVLTKPVKEADLRKFLLQADQRRRKALATADGS